MPTKAQVKEGAALARRYLLASLRDKSDSELLQAIKTHQDAQKRNAPSTDEWESASRSLAILFTEMQRRYPVGAVGPAVLS